MSLLTNGMIKLAKRIAKTIASVYGTSRNPHSRIHPLITPIIIPNIHFPVLVLGVEYGSENKKTIQKRLEAVNIL